MGQNQSGPEKKKNDNAGPESAWPSNITSGGELFSPLPSCMQNVVRSACREEKNHESANN